MKIYFNLLQNYLNHKIVDLKSDLLSEQNSKSIKEKTKSIKEKPQLGIHRTPDQPPGTETVPNPAYGTTYAHQMPPFRTVATRRGPCPWDLCHLCKQTGHWRRDCPLNFKQGIKAHGQSSATTKQCNFKRSR